LTEDRLRVEFYDANGKRLYDAGKRLSPPTDIFASQHANAFRSDS
jgi:hypothetical protein